eukprot:7281795-Alexandrium_andersonii.AAC.1
MSGKASAVNAVTALKLYPAAILVSAKANWAAIALRMTVMPVIHVLTLGKPAGSLVSRARPGCHDMKT